MQSFTCLDAVMRLCHRLLPPPAPRTVVGGEVVRSIQRVLVSFAMTLGVFHLVALPEPAAADDTELTINVGRDGALEAPIQLPRNAVRLITISGLNPFAGTYTITVNERVYAESAIPAFIAALGVVIPTGGEAKAIDGGPVNGFAPEFPGVEVPRTAVERSDCTKEDERAIAVEAERVRTARDKIQSADKSLSGFRLADHARRDRISTAISTIVSPGADSEHVRAAFRTIADLSQEAAEEARSELSSDALARLFGVVEEARTALTNYTCESAKWHRREADDILARKADLVSAARYRETRLTKAEEAGAYASQIDAEFPKFQKLFQQPVLLGPYDQSTVVTLTVSFTPTALLSLPLGPEGALLVEKPKSETTGEKKVEAKPEPPRAPALLVVRRLQFGHAKMLGLGAAVVSPTGKNRFEEEFGARFADPSDTLRTVFRTRGRYVIQPLLDLSVRVLGGAEDADGATVTLHAGVGPSLQGQVSTPAYFLGAGLSFLDDRVGVLAGWFDFPARRLGDGLRVGDKLHRDQTAPRVVDERVSALAVGVSLRAY
ncbi:MAG: hypothetical protein IT349_09085 [Candidatus Eisenbacteria bacterium]|nr:hypothetical protein [Candidatus Eisenbacteria bacterium]